jgi:3D (Asp-Asp-Asp) domain-containing protein
VTERGEAMKSKIPFLLITSLLICTNDVRGQENYPTQTFSKCVELSVQSGQWKQQQEYIKEEEFVITAYTLREGGKSPSDPEYGITASMQRGIPFKTVAMDTRRYPFGTVIQVDGIKQPLICMDRGGAIKGQRIDLLVNTSRQAKDWGRRTLKVKILKMGDGKINE